MSTAAKTVDHMKILKDMGDGLLNRLYHFKGALLSKSKPSCLIDADTAKIRIKVEKKFPVLPETQKLQGWDAFVEYSPIVLTELAGPYELIADIMEFSVLSKNALKDITVSIVDFKLARNRCLTLMYLDLLVVYIRVMKMFELIEDRLTIVALYTAVYNLQPEVDRSFSATRTNRIKLLLSDAADLSRHFIDLFSSSLVFVKPILLQLKDTIGVADNVEKMRNDYVLNPINEGDHMSQPTLKMLNSTTNVSLCSELVSLEKYYEYVAYIFVAFPALLYQEPCLEVLKAVTNSRLVVELFRDISLNIHIELEKISVHFPGPADNPASLQLPKGLKLKVLLKTISRSSVVTAAHKMRERRSFLEAELGNLNRLITAVPGLIGPKFPMLLAAAALAKSEVVAYFRHAEGVAVRKDTKAHYVAGHYYAEDISNLMREAHRASVAMRTHRAIITTYYAEYLAVNDAKAVHKLTSACGDGVDSLTIYLDAIFAILDGLKSTSPSTVPAVKELEGFRLTWERALAVASSQGMSHVIRAIAVPFDALAQRMLFVFDRSLYRDSLDELVDMHVDFHQIGWFRTTFLSAFSVAMTDPNGLAQNSWLFFLPLQSIRLSCHEECPEEVLSVNIKAGVLANTMLSDIGDFAVTLVTFLWDFISYLQSQYHPAEVGKRAERIAQSKQRGGAAAAAAAAQQDALPGVESEVWAKKQIERFVLIQQHLTWLVASAKAFGTFKVHNLEYTPDLYLQEQVLAYFTNRLHSLFQTSDKTPLRFSSSFRKLTCGCLAMQHALRLLDVDIGTAVQDVFFAEFQDATQVPPPGLSVPLQANLDQEKLIYKLGVWFVELAHQIARPGSGLVWSPVHELFVNATHQGSNADFAVETVLNRVELQQLVTMIGVQGVKAIESQLLTALAAELSVVTKFVGDNRNYLRQYESTYCLVLNAAVNVQKNDAMFDALRTIGVILLIRDMLHNALSTCYATRFTDLQNALRDGTEALDFYTEPQLGAALACLASDMGIMTEERDLALCAALARTNLAADKDILNLLPVAAAALFVSEKWEKSRYLLRLEAFENNEHCIQVALSKLFSTCYTLYSSTLGQDPKDSADDTQSLPETDIEGPEPIEVKKVATRLAKRDRYKQYVERYVRIAAQTLLVQREGEALTQGHKKAATQAPHRCMSLMLEYFASLSAVVEPGTLEKYLPNHLVHTDRMDVSLGKQKAADVLRPFTHAAASAAQADAQEQF